MVTAIMNLGNLPKYVTSLFF